MKFFCNVKTDDTPYYARDSFTCFMVNTPFLVMIKSDIITSNYKHEVNMRYLFSTSSIQIDTRKGHLILS